MFSNLCTQSHHCDLLRLTCLEVLGKYDKGRRDMEAEAEAMVSPPSQPIVSVSLSYTILGVSYRSHLVEHKSVPLLWGIHSIKLRCA